MTLSYFETVRLDLPIVSADDMDHEPLLGSAFATAAMHHIAPFLLIHAFQ